MGQHFVARFSLLLPWVPEVVSLGIGLEYGFRPASAKRDPTGRRPGASVNCSLRALAAGLHARSRPSACRIALRARWSETIFQAYSKRDDLWHPGYTFIFFELNNYPVCDLKLILDTNIFITATISCTMCMLPLDLY